jgi:hypothetical protein
MNTQRTAHKNLAVLAHMLDRLERSRTPVDAAQYRSLVARLSAELESVPHDAGLDAVLDAFPCVAELYENLNYRHAGLCRSPLEPGLAAEMAARNAIEAASGAAHRPKV